MCDFLLELSGYVSAFPIAGLVFLVVGMVAALCMPLINIVNEAAMERIKREHKEAGKRQNDREASTSQSSGVATEQPPLARNDHLGNVDPEAQGGLENFLLTRDRSVSLAKARNPVEQLQALRATVFNWRAICCRANFDDDQDAQKYLKRKIAEFKVPVLQMTFKPYVTGLSICCLLLSVYVLLVSMKMSDGVKTRWREDGLHGITTGVDVLVCSVIGIPFSIVNSVRPAINTIIKYADDNGRYQATRKLFGVCFLLSMGMYIAVCALVWPYIIYSMYAFAVAFVAVFAAWLALLCTICCIVPVGVCVYQVMRVVVSLVLSPLDATDKEVNFVANVICSSGMFFLCYVYAICAMYFLVGGPRASRICFNTSDLTSSFVYVLAQPLLFGLVGSVAKRFFDDDRKSRDDAAATERT